MIIILWLYSPLRVRTYKPTIGLKFTCPQTEVKYDPASLGVACD